MKLTTIEVRGVTASGVHYTLVVPVTWLPWLTQRRPYKRGGNNDMAAANLARAKRRKRK